MKISGLQKMTLLDYPGKVACTVFLGGCNFRCPFCHNSDLLDGNAPEYMTLQELISFLEKRVGILDAVCITGGEPTLQPKLEELISSIKELGFLVKLDTNGTRPETVKKLAAQNLIDYVAMDIKNCPGRYAETGGLTAISLTALEESIRFLLIGNVDYELRTTVVAQLHDKQSFVEIGRWLQSIAPDKKAKRFFLQPFTDRDTVLFSSLSAPSNAELEDYARVCCEFADFVKIRGV